LDGFAQRGGTGDTKHRPVENEQSLLMEFTRITGAIASCSFQLSMAPEHPEYVLVKMDGQQLNLNQSDGFRITDRTVELTGGSCSRFRDGTHVLDAQVLCAIVQPM
jgi:hypothetical protein